MLLVANPGAEDLERVISGLLDGRLSRDEVLSWQQAVQAQHGFDISITVRNGYWYFYSLAFVQLPFPGGYFLRERDLEEYLADINGVPGDSLTTDIMHQRSHQIDPSALRWPLALISDNRDLMNELPSARGTFERRLDMVEHCLLLFQGNHYLLVKEFDEQAGQLLLLGGSRDRELASALLDALAITDYIFP